MEYGKMNYEKFLQTFKKKDHLYVCGDDWRTFGYVDYIGPDGFNLVNIENKKANHFNWNQFTVITRDALLIEKKGAPKKVTAISFQVLKDNNHTLHEPAWSVDTKTKNINLEKSGKLLFSGKPELLRIVKQLLSAGFSISYNKGAECTQLVTNNDKWTVKTRETWFNKSKVVKIKMSVRERVPFSEWYSSAIIPSVASTYSDCIWLLATDGYNKSIYNDKMLEEALDIKNWQVVSGDPFVHTNNPAVMFNSAAIHFCAVGW